MQHKIFNSVSSERKFRISIFNDIEDYSPKYGFFTLKELSDTFAYSQETEFKGSTPLFNGTYFSKNNRQLEYAQYSDLLIFDFDGKQHFYNEDQLKDIFSDYHFFAYETASSSHIWDEYRWRLILPLTRSVSPLEYEALYNHFLEQYRLDVDKQTRSINAIFYLPEHQESIDGSDPIFIENKSTLLNPSLILKNRIIDNVKRAFNTDIRLTELKLDDATTLCGFSYIPSEKTKFSCEEIKDLTTQPAIGLKLASLIGIDVERSGIDAKTGRFKSRALTSVLPWHEKDNKPSTGIMIKEHGEYAGKVFYKSFKDEDANSPIFDLHYVYACQKVGKKIPNEQWTKSTSLVWLVRALIDCGVISPKDDFKINLNGLEGLTKQLYSSMLELAKCRSMLDFYEEEVPFSFSFAEVWTGISRQSASKHFKIIESLGLVHRTVVQTERMKINGFIPLFSKGKLRAKDNQEKGISALDISHYIEVASNDKHNDYFKANLPTMEGEGVHHNKEFKPPI